LSYSRIHYLFYVFYISFVNFQEVILGVFVLKAAEIL